MFDLDQFVADCRTAIAQDPSHKFVREIVARAVSDPVLLCLKASVSQSAQQFSPCRIFSHCWQRHGSTNVRHAMR
jgi:hypothetical protein